MKVDKRASTASRDQRLVVLLVALAWWSSPFPYFLPRHHKGRVVVQILLLVDALVVRPEQRTMPQQQAAGPPRPTVLVTGSTDGIGLTTAKNLAAKGFNVLLHGRDEGRIQSAANEVASFCRRDRSNDPGAVIALPAADFSTVGGCLRLADDVKSACQDRGLALTVLMNNAGVYSKDGPVRTSDGLELTFAVNVLAPFVLSSMLLSTLLRQPKGSRIVIASSVSQSRAVRAWDDVDRGARGSYSAHGAYSESKLLDAMLAVEMAVRLRNGGLGTDRITCNCLDPGTVNTKMLLAGWGRIGIDVEDALDETWLCSSDEVRDVTGEYFVSKASRRAASSVYDSRERDRLWSTLARLAPEAAKEWERAVEEAGR